MRENPICTNETLDKLETQLKALTTRPVGRRGWTLRVIERLRVVEAAVDLLRGRYGTGDEEWQECLTMATVRLRREGKIVDSDHGGKPGKVRRGPKLKSLDGNQ